MWPLDLPAREVLKPTGQARIAWAAFDADWYRAAYPEIVARLVDGSIEAALDFYLEHGQDLGHSPNRFFHEAWHRHVHPGITAAVRAGKFRSAFDAYCRGGSLDRAPHWLFDELLYRRRHPDLTDDALQAGELVNGYDHYLRHGNREGRIGHLFFDPAFYRAQFDPADAERVQSEGPFQHYLARLDQRKPDLPTSVYFDPAWYAARYPSVAEAIEQGEWRSALEHYLRNDRPTLFDPLPAFSEAYYLARYPDLLAALDRRHFRNGYAHFLRHGARELRQPSQALDPGWYAAQDVVRTDLERGLAPDAFTHWLTIGRKRGLRPAPPAEEKVTEIQAEALFRQRARAMLPALGRLGLRFEPGGAPVVTVILVVRDQFPATLTTLASLRSNLPDPVDLVLVDCGSTDETQALEHYVSGATILRFGSDIGFSRACNAALQCARADAVLYLANGTELAPGAIGAALRRLHADDRIGAVGGKIVRAHGLLDEAGGIVWSDGTLRPYLRDVSPLAPEANFVRDVDVCSLAFLLVRRDLLRDLNGLDETFAATFYEAAELCARIAGAGRRVVYEPSSVAHVHQPGTGSAPRPSEAERAAARQVFMARHAAFLATRHSPDGRGHVARMADRGRKQVLFIEDTVPLRRIGSGFVRSNDLIRAMADLGHAVTVFPVNGCRFDLASVYADLPDTVEIMHDQALEQFPGFMAARRDCYDVIWVARTHNLDRVLPALQRILADAARPVRIVLDTEAIAASREAEQAALHGQPFDLDAAIRQEFSNAGACHDIVAVTAAEADTLRALGFGTVSVIGHMRPLCPTPRPFAERQGMLFVGAMHRMDSPNYDGLCWFVDSVLPLVEASLGWRTRLTVVGYTGPDVVLDRFRNHPRITLRGSVASIEPLYESHRVFVAPTRFGAGVPYKIHEAASYGLPVVATDLLRRQLGWTHGADLLAADPADPRAMAEQIVRLWGDGGLWQSVRDNALARLARENSPDRCAEAISRILGPARLDTPR